MKYALVTGGSRGIGRAVSVALARDGYTIIINYRSRSEEAEETLRLVREAGSDGELLPFDVANREQTAAALEKWAAEHPGEYIACVVNNAGIRKDNLMVFMQPEDWSSVLHITLDGFYNVTQPLLQNMLVKKFGRIINMVSLSGLKGLPGQTNYSCSKGGLIAATKALAQEVARKNVTVNAVAPGFIHSDMTADLDEASIKKTIPAGRFGDASEVADLVAFLASERASYITGEVISINGGLYT
ncbi:MAG: 3-oxoacyl-ACP reductase FabG [Bacteroidales bacterium]|jgi:3-oxoacyl-[acyl-carrier protein] reductase|nr:3-oxoacyl-ACP reductase FabG [Bacteroidales bacterium]MBP5418928.1 3-oxoacyl-ACP reductase FabG [Bacteroidales bacterium]